MMSRYDKYISGKAEIELGGVVNELWASPKDYAEFIRLAKSIKETQDLEPIVEFTIKLIKAGTPKEEVAEPKFEEGLRMYLWKNVKDLANELSIAFGLTTREELEKAKKEVEKLSRKKQLAS